MKLSDKQKEVIKLMREGYELGRTSGFCTGTWLQLGGCGKGGKTKPCTSPTLSVLKRLSLIERTGGRSGTDYFNLTELGKTIEL